MNQNTHQLKGSPRRSLTAATLGFFVAFSGVALFGPVAAEFQAEMELTGLLLAGLVAAPQLLGSLLRVPFGAWVEDVGPKKPFLILLGLSITGMAGLTAVLFLWYPGGLELSHYPLLFLFGALSGCGIGAFSVGTAQTAYWYPQKRQGTALAVYAGLGNTSPGIFTLILPAALVVLGLQGAYVAWLVFLIVGTIAYAVMAVDPYYFQLKRQGADDHAARQGALAAGQELLPTGSARTSLREAARLGATWVLVALYLVSFGGFLALTVWLPSYFQNFHGLDASGAGLVTALAFVLLATLVRVPGGVISDRLGGERTAVGSYLLMGMGAGTLVLTHHPATAAAAVIIMAAAMGLANAAVFKLVPAYVPRAVGAASGLVGGLGAFGGFVIPPLLGIFVDMLGLSGYRYGFVIFVVLALTAAALAAYLYRRRGAAGTGEAEPDP